MADIGQSDRNKSNPGRPASNALDFTDSSSLQDFAPYLDHKQQDLLLAALSSQTHHDQLSKIKLERSDTQSRRSEHNTQSANNPSQMATLDNTYTPDLLDFEDNFDFDNTDPGGQMIGSLPGNYEDSTGAEQHDKRKNPDDEEVEGGDSKRQEIGDKSAKKPGRKPLMSEPTTKRKAQNRAAQRAFRERKEAHLKDLETKVTELQKSSEADKHENGLLKAQVSRLEIELREYRKRLSLDSNGAKRSPTSSFSQSAARNQMGFQFEFPKFGSLPSAQILGGSLTNNNITPPLSNHSPISTTFNSQSSQPSRHNSQGQSMSPTTQSQISNPSHVSSVDPVFTGSYLPYSTSDNMHGFASTLPQMGKDGNDPFGDLFSPSILKSVSTGGTNGNYFAEPSTINDKSISNGGDSTAGIPDNRVFRFNSTSIGSDSASPSTSSFSQGYTANSSCGTSPEPVKDSPATKLKTMGTNTNSNNSQFSFTQLPSQSTTDNFNFASLHNFNVPQADTFDPVLFADYRDTNDNVVGGGDFNGGFFDQSYNSSGLDFGSPSNLFGILSPSVPQASTTMTPSRNLIQECDKARDGGGDDYGLPKANQPANSDNGKLISCTKIWSQLQENPDFQDGNFDLDGLCSELRTKARCSESGLMVDSDHFDAAFKKMIQNKPEVSQSPRLLFEQESWDDVLKKLQAGKR